MNIFVRCIYIPVNFYPNAELYVRIKISIYTYEGFVKTTVVPNALKFNSVQKTEIKIATGDEVC